MKALILTGFVVALAVLRPGTAMADTWCIRDKTSARPVVCGFVSAFDCARAAAIGGPPATICEREDWDVDSATPAAHSRSSRQQQPADR